ASSAVNETSTSRDVSSAAPTSAPRACTVWRICPKTSRSHEASAPALQPLWSGNAPNPPGNDALDSRWRTWPPDTVAEGVRSRSERSRSERAALTRARAACTSRLARRTSPIKRDNVVSPNRCQYSDAGAVESAGATKDEGTVGAAARYARSEEHTSELQSLAYLVC